jgi:HD-GYP domain-containing protein (c-di-GMP phosphodiesterase class II)
MKIRRVTPADLKLGMLLPWNVYGDNGMLLVRKGHMISSANQIDSLVERGSFEDDSDLPPPAREPESVVRKLNQVHLQLQTLLEAMAARMAPPNSRRHLEDLGVMVDDAVALSGDVAIASVLHNQQAAPYAVRHSVDTAVVAQVAARALKLPAPQRMAMTLAALTMNVGMLEQHDRLHLARGDLDKDEQRRLRAHPELGVALLRLAGVTDPDWLDAVLHHHENEDGSGYPRGKAGAQIPQAAKLIALADRYCARVSERGYRQPMLPNAALRDILLERQTLDGQLTAVLIRELGIYPVGTYVRLLNGEIAVVSRKGLQPTTPHVESVIGPRGAPLEVFLRRDTKGELNGIREVLSTAQVVALRAPLRMEQVWGRVASA